MTTHVKRTVLWLALVSAYWVVFAGLPGRAGDHRPVDPLNGRPRVLEAAIAEGRFSEALPLAIELQRASPEDPLVYVWLADIYHGLARPADEAAAWEAFLERSTARDVACPSLAMAYERAGQAAEAIHAFERCVEFDRREPERHIDLAEALERAGRVDEAAAIWARLAEQNQANPNLLARIDHLRDHHGVEP